MDNMVAQISINNIKEIENFEDFSSVFKVFEKFPFFEKWTLNQIRSEFDISTKNGKVLGYYQNNICIGFISMRQHQPNEHPIHFGHEAKVIYISDIAVLPNYRRQGIASLLLHYALQIAISKNYEIAYLRINDDNPMGDNIAKRQGFRRDYEFCEIVEQPNTSCFESDFRIFMSKKLI